VKATTVPAVGEVAEPESVVEVASVLTKMVAGEEVLGEKIAATYAVVKLNPYCVKPWNFTASEWTPGPNSAVSKYAIPLELILAEPKLAEPSRNVTTPDGMGTAPVTCAASRTVWLARTTEGVAVRTVCVA